MSKLVISEKRILYLILIYEVYYKNTANWEYVIQENDDYAKCGSGWGPMG